MNTLLLKAREVALETRAWAEWEADSADSRSEDLNGWCAIASGELHKRLEKVGIKAEIHMARTEECSCHVFVVVDDHVVDVTATQFHLFRGEHVLIKHQRELDHHWFYLTEQVFKSAKELRRHQIKTDWDKAQIAYG